MLVGGGLLTSIASHIDTGMTRELCDVTADDEDTLVMGKRGRDRRIPYATIGDVRCLSSPGDPQMDSSCQNRV